MLSLNTWYLTIDMLSLDTWHMLSHGTSTHLTWYCDTWLDTITPDTYMTLHIHDYHCYGDLTWFLFCYQTFGTPELLYSWTPVTGRLLILFSWCHTPVDPRNWLIMVVGLLCIRCGHYHWTMYIYNKVLNLHWGGENWWIPVWCHIYNGDIGSVVWGA